MESANGLLIDQYNDIMHREKIAYIRLVPLPPPDYDSEFDEEDWELSMLVVPIEHPFRQLYGKENL